MKLWYVAFLISVFSLLMVPFAKANTCTASCPGEGDVEVNLQDKCMCLGDECFEISIGRNGPEMTASGTGVLAEAEGAKYSTKPGPGSTGYDKDAIRMGIPSNDGVGKWIHKTQGCSPGGGENTKGCIAVPCDRWPEVKAKMGGVLKVCGSSQNSVGTGTNSGSGGASRQRGQR